MATNIEAIKAENTRNQSIKRTKVTDIDADLLRIIKKAMMVEIYSGMSSKTARENIEQVIADKSAIYGLNQSELEKLAAWWLTFDTSELKPLIRHIYGHKQSSLNGMVNNMMSVS
jgi:hypothetical protein